MRAPDRLGALAQGCGFVALVLVIPERGSAGRLSGSARPMERAKKVKEAPPSGGSEARPTRDALILASPLRAVSPEAATAVRSAVARPTSPMPPEGDIRAREDREATAGPDPTRLVAPKPAAEDPETPPLRQGGLGAASAFGPALRAEPSGHHRAPDSPLASSSAPSTMPPHVTTPHERAPLRAGREEYRHTRTILSSPLCHPRPEAARAAAGEGDPGNAGAAEAGFWVPFPRRFAARRE
jgi:hypothetical protein